MSEIPSPEQAAYQEDLRRRLQTARRERHEEEDARWDAYPESVHDIQVNAEAVLEHYREQERVAAEVDELMQRVGVDAERTQRSEPDRMKQNAVQTRGAGIDRRSRIPGRISVQTHHIARVETTYSTPVEVARDGDSPIFAVFSIKREVVPTGRRKHVSDDPGTPGRIVGTGVEFFEGSVPSAAPAFPGEGVHHSPIPDLGPFESNMPIARERPTRKGGGYDAFGILSEFSPRYARVSDPEKTRANLLNAADDRLEGETAILSEIGTTAALATANLDAQEAADAEAARVAALPPAPPETPPAPPAPPGTPPAPW